MFDMTELSRQHGSAETEARLHRRRRSETRLKALGIGAISLAGLALLTLTWSIVFKAANALFEYTVPMEIALDLGEEELARVRDPNPRIIPDLGGIVREAAAQVEAEGLMRDALLSLLAGNSGFELGRMVKADPSLVGRAVSFDALLSDEAQLYLKGHFGRFEPQEVEGSLSPTGATGEVELVSTAGDFRDALAVVKAGLVDQAEELREQAARQNHAVEVFTEQMEAAETDRAREALERRAATAAERRDALLAEAEALERRAAEPGGIEPAGNELPSVFVRINEGWVRATEIGEDRLVGDVLVPLWSTAEAPPESWSLHVLESPERGRAVTDAQALELERLEARGLVEGGFNWRFFLSPDSRDAALAGIWGALVGSALTMLVTFLLAFPIGVAASIYLEEFAPKNRLTNFIEVNINNLAAVPSIVFGLLGLAVVLPLMNQLVGVNLRSAPLIGGTVLALMSLPTIIIASRAAIRAVPPSIREAALGVGASKLQATFHHVLPLALPGIMTGTIIALAQALGETAPLLMIGMVAFIVDVPEGVTDSATVLPVQIYRWSDFPERLFELKTALAILTLLAFLVVMNAIAVVLRRRFERRW